MLSPLLLAFACVAPDPSHGLSDPRDTAVDTGGAEEAQTELDPFTTTVVGIDGLVRVSWEPGMAGESWVEYGLDGDLDQRTPAYAELHAVHEVVLLGLKLGRRYDYRVCTLTEAGELLISEVGTIDVPPPPHELVPAHLIIDSPGAHQGFVIVPQLGAGGAWITILDADGDYVWVWRDESRVTIPAIDLHPSGHALVYSRQSVERDVDLGEVVEQRLDGAAAPLRTRTYQGHHAFAQLPDGSYGRLSMEQRQLSVDGAVQLVTGDRLIEVARGEQDRSQYGVVFDFFEDYDVLPGPEIFDDPDWMNGRDWTHANSLVYLPPKVKEGEAPEPMGGDYYLGARNLDTILKIDRRTGEIIWSMGGPGSDFYLSADAAFSHAHFSEVWEGGLLMMDNRRAPETSRVVEYAWDEVVHVVKKVWEYAPPDAAWISFLGDARRLPGDHVLVSWTSEGTLEEVTREGEVLWRVQLDLGGAWGRVLWVPDLYDPLGLDG